MKSTEFSATTAEAAEALCISRKTLQRLSVQEVLRLGVHFRYVGTGSVRPQLRWNIAACDATLTLRSRRQKRRPTPQPAAVEVG